MTSLRAPDGTVLARWPPPDSASSRTPTCTTRNHSSSRPPRSRSTKLSPVPLPFETSQGWARLVRCWRAERPETKGIVSCVLTKIAVRTSSTNYHPPPERFQLTRALHGDISQGLVKKSRRRHHARLQGFSGLPDPCLHTTGGGPLPSNLDGHPVVNYDFPPPTSSIRTPISPWHRTTVVLVSRLTRATTLSWSCQKARLEALERHIDPPSRLGRRTQGGAHATSGAALFAIQSPDIPARPPTSSFNLVLC